MIDASRFSKGGKYYDSSRELHDNIPLISHLLSRKSDRKATEFPGSKNWILIEWDPELITTDKINEMLFDALRHKMLGMNSVAMYLFSSDTRRAVIIPPRQYRRIAAYRQLISKEGNQAKMFWRGVRIFANRRQIAFSERRSKRDSEPDIDILNYRINSVGNILRKNILKYPGRGSNFFSGSVASHTIPTLDVAETVRPLLYFVVLRSLSLPMDRVRPLIDKIITDGLRWVMNRMELISGQEVERYKINYHEYCRIINDQIREIELQTVDPYTQHKVTEYRKPGMIHFITPTKEIEAGEEIHCQLLSEFSQPLSMNKTRISNSDYLSAFAEVKISSNNMVGKFDLIIVNNRLEVLLIVDLKTHEREYFELFDSQRSQVNSYLRILEDKGYNVENTIRSVIHIHRKYVPDTIKPVVDWIIKHRELLTKELKTHDLNTCKKLEIKNSDNGSTNSRFDKTPSLKKENLDFLADPPAYDTGCVGISMWG